MSYTGTGSNNVQKIPLVYTSGAAMLKRVRQALDITGKSLPCTIAQVISSGIVTVNFEMNAAPYTLPQITVPVHGTEYIRVPYQVGCKGFVNTADYYLGGMSGLGGGTADLTQRANLAALVFCPIGNTAWSTTNISANLLCQYGPSGVRLMDQAGDCIFTLTATGITVTIGGTTVWSISASQMLSNPNIKTNGDISTATLTSVDSHIHSDPQGGSTGGPTG